MARGIQRYLPGLASIRVRIVLFFWVFALIASLLVRISNYNFISALAYSGVDEDLRLIVDTHSRLAREGFEPARLSRLMDTLLQDLAGNKLEPLQKFLGRLYLVEETPRQYFAGIVRAAPGDGALVLDNRVEPWRVPDGLAITPTEGEPGAPWTLRNGQYRVTMRPLGDGTLLLAGASISDIKKTQNGLIYFYALNVVGWTSLLALLSLWLMSIALRPLQRVAELAGRIEAGETHLRIRPQEMVVEIGRLGEALNAMLDRLEGQLQAHARFTADISHELGNPLGSVMLQMQVASEEETSPEELRATLRSCLEITRRMNHLRQSLLNLSLAQARQGTHHPDIDLEPVVEEAVEAVERAAEAKDVAIETQGTAIVLPGNPELLHQLLVNLLSNAIRHTPEGSVVRVRVRPAEVDGKPMVSIGVLDEGRGVPPEDVPELFERFFRSQSERLVRPNGHGGTRTGLGLAICKSIAKAHQGIIRYSPGPQGGALFEVLLPAKSTQDQPG